MNTLDRLERMFKNFASWGLGSLVGAGCVAFLMLMFPHAIRNSLPTTTNLYLGAFVGLACHRVVNAIVKWLTPRNAEALKAGENIDKKVAATLLLPPPEQQAIAEELLATAAGIPKATVKAPRKPRKKTPSGG